MALNIDFSPTNRSINLMARLLGQRGLSKQAHEQSLFREQERGAGLEARALTGHKQRMVEEEEKQKNRVRLIYENIKRDVATDPTLNPLNVKRKIALLEGNNDLAMDLTRQMRPGLIDHAATELRLLNIPPEQATPEQAADAFMLVGVKETGTTLRKSADIRLDEAGLEETRLGRGVRERELEEKITARGQKELEAGKESQEEYQAYIASIGKEAKTFIDNVLKNPDNYIESDEEGNILDLSAREAAAQIGLQSVSKEDLRKLITKVNKFVDKSRKTKLNQREMDFLLGIQNLEEQLPRLKEKTLPGMAYSPEGIALTEQVQRDIKEEQIVAGELTPEESINVLAGMILEKAKARGAEMTMEEAMAAARRLIGIR